ncbi:tRNA epoxyqueuosine(34) reductase QueG [Robbsia betulipollinis]|uniref:tRNA epoxyqueuosine(34) reductase QueG n=1 Tax=Robbsia betulipollinis TaxID=2981849 RepID=UPI0032C49B66
MEPPNVGRSVAALSVPALAELATRIKTWGRELGFDAVGIGDIDLSGAEEGLQAWLDAGYHGDMDYMEKHGLRRARPAELVPGTLRVISVRLPYLPGAVLAAGHADTAPTPDWRAGERARLADPSAAVVSVYARGRDYHKVLRQRLQRLADRIAAAIGPFGHRVFTDSAPVMEVELARRAGVGWRGKHTLLLARDAGSFFFIGEMYVDLPLPTDMATAAAPLPPADGAHCGACRRCIDACPTGAIVAPYRLDARRCISYLTIEHKGSIPEPLRAAIGNRVYGCDDCQTVCPWNKFAQAAPVADFDTRNGLDRASLLDLFGWSEADFDRRLEGSAIRRIGHAQWLRNLAVGLGNALRAPPPAAPDAAQRQAIVAALHGRAAHPCATVREHVEWALLAAEPIR